MQKAFFFFRSFKAKIMFFFILAIVFVVVVSDLMIQRYAMRLQLEQLRQRLMIIAEIASVNVDAQKLKKIPLNKEGIASPQYQEIHEKLTKIINSAPSLKYLYIMQKTLKPGILSFIVDVDSTPGDGSGPPTYPGDEYNARRFPQMLEGFNRPAADKALMTDEWGIFLSAYAPIRDEDGKTIAILGIDMKAQDVFDLQKEVKRRTLFVLGLSVLLAFILGIVLSAGLSRQISELVKGAKRIAKGDLDYKVLVKGADEIARLAFLFNRMSSDLKEHIKELQRTTAEKERLVKEIEIAHGIQQSFLPDCAPKIAGIDIAALTLPARIVGGDFYDFIPIEKDKWGLAIADVSGKGVPAALFMALSRTLMRASASVTLSPSEAVEHANTMILQDSKSNMFVTVFYAVLDVAKMSFKYANAGHNPALFIKGLSNDITVLKAQSAPLGIMDDIKLNTEEITLKKGDIIMLYTDGVTEAGNKEGEQFQISRLEKVLIESRGLIASQIISKVREELSLFVGGQPQFDDITIMIIKAV